MLKRKLVCDSIDSIENHSHNLGGAMPAEVLSYFLKIVTRGCAWHFRWCFSVRLF